MINQLAQFGQNGMNGNGAPKRVVVLHRQAREWRLLRLSREDKGGRIELEEHTSIAVSDVSGLKRLLADYDADLVVRILPGGTVVCRTLQIPKMTAESLDEVIDLQAEAVLPAGIEDHRRAVAMLPWSQELAEEFEALAFGWPGVVPADLDEIEEPEFVYAPGLAGLAEILCRAHGDAFAAYLDKDGETFELLMHHQGRTAVRTVRIDGKQEVWGERLDQVFVETAISIDLTLDEIADWREKLRDHAGRYAQMPLVNDEARQQVGMQIGGGLEELGMDWWKKFGLGVVVGIGVFGPRRRLFELLAERPEERRNRVAEVLRWVDEPSRAILVLLIAVLAISLLPLGSAWARRSILNSKLGAAGDVNVNVVARDLGYEAQYYEVLNKRRWPMTKLLADISGAAPYEVEIDEITIDAGDGTKGGLVRLKGTAPSRDEETSFRSELENRGIFKKVSVPRSDEKRGKIEFEMTFIVDKPLLRIEPTFGDTLLSHLYGDDATAMVEEGGIGEIAGSELSSAGDENIFGGGGTELPGAADDGGTASAGGNDPGSQGWVNPVQQAKARRDAAREGRNIEKVIPDALTATAIETMSQEDALAATLQRARVMYDRSLDPSTQTRLRDEYTRLAARIKQLKAEAGDGN